MDEDGVPHVQDDLFTFLTNKDGLCRQGSLIATVRSTKAEEVLAILFKIPEEEQLKVAAFPNAILTLDCFHIMKRCIDGAEEIRLRYRREAQAEHGAISRTHE